MTDKETTELFKIALTWTNGDAQRAAKLVESYYAGQVAAMILESELSAVEL